MKRRQFILGGVGALSSAGVARAAEAGYVTRVVVNKRRRRLYLMSGTRTLRIMRIGLGFAPTGHKRFEGDGRTPEGSYIIDHRNPNSQFHLSMGISYPNRADRAYAQSRGRSAGGEIFVHGRAGKHRGKGRDWTAGCIALKDRDMELFYRSVRVGTQIDIWA